MSAISILIKPSSSNCNLTCEYCFYNDVANNRLEKAMGFMSEETAEELVKRALEKDQNVNFIFQGGEPTLVGLPFYQRFVAFVNQYKQKHLVSYAIQTNGVLLDEAYCTFFKEHNFLVGVSLDGPKAVHDLYRKSSSFHSTYDRVMHGIGLLKKHQVDFNILTVVTQNTVEHVEEIYAFFKGENFSYLQFIPSITDFHDKENYLTSKDYGVFLKKLFELWKKDILAGKLISIRQFDNYVQMILGYPPSSCDMSGFCTLNPVIEADGSVYPCDFYSIDNWYMGNIHNKSFESLFSSHKANEFLISNGPLNAECKACTYVKLCRGGCKRYKEMGNGKHFYCDAYKYFFDHCLEGLLEVVDYFRSLRQQN